MRVARDRLIFLALCALDEIIDQAEHWPIKPTFALRFTLAFLHALSDGRARSCYDGFWRCVTPQREPHREHRLYYGYADSHLRGIAKSLGFDFEVDLRERINRARGLPPGHRSLMSRSWKVAAAELDRQKEQARRARYCDLERVEPFPKRRG